MKNVKKLYLKIHKLYNKLYKQIKTMIQTNFIQQSTSPMEPTGTWINTKTGETITIKTMVNDMSGNGSQLMLTDGRLISFTEFSNNYIQMEEDSTNQQNDMMSNTTKETPRLNIDLLTAGLGQNNNITNMCHMSETNVTLNTNNKLESFDSPYETPFENVEEVGTLTNQSRKINLDNNINKISINNIDYLNNYTKQQNIVKEFLNNLEKRPTINFKSIYIENMPTEPISTFIKYLGVTKEDIVDVLYKELCNEHAIKDILTNYINNIIKDEQKQISSTTIIPSTTKSSNKIKKSKISK